MNAEPAQGALRKRRGEIRRRDLVGIEGAALIGDHGGDLVGLRGDERDPGRLSGISLRGIHCAREACGTLRARAASGGPAHPVTWPLPSKSIRRGEPDSRGVIPDSGSEAAMLAADSSNNDGDNSSLATLSPFMSSEAATRASASGANSLAVLSPDDLQAFLNR